MRSWKIDQENPLGIKSKKDWVITFLFAFLIVYAISTRFSRQVDNWLFNFTPAFFSDWNQLKSYGNWLITIPVMTFLTEIVLFIYRKSRKVKLLTLAGAMVLCLGVFFGYQLHSSLVVSVMDRKEPEGVNFDVRMGDGSWKQAELSAAEKEELVSLCKSLRPLLEEEQKELYAAYKNSEGDWFMNADEIRIHYPKQYGHDFILNVRIYDGHIYVRKGYNEKQKELITFYEDNGLLEAVERIRVYPSLME